MTKLAWDQVGEKTYETGVDQGVLYIPNAAGVYAAGFAWNGLTAVTESPSGAESNKQYADNGVYLNLQSAEEFGGTIEAFTYPDEFGQCDGSEEPVDGVILGQQGRKAFGFSYRTLKGNDTQGTDFGYKLHLIYGCLASPSEKANSTVNDSPEATAFSWEFSTTPVPVGEVNGKVYKPTSHVTIDSTKVTEAQLKAVEDAIYGTAGSTAGSQPKLPTPAEIIALVAPPATP